MFYRSITVNKVNMCILILGVVSCDFTGCICDYRKLMIFYFIILFYGSMQFSEVDRTLKNR